MGPHIGEWKRDVFVTIGCGGSVRVSLQHLPPRQGPKGFIERAGGPVIFSYRITRLAACVSLLAFETWGLLYYAGIAEWYDTILEYGLCGVWAYTYMSVLALLSVLCSPAQARLATSHSSVVLAIAWVVFAYRDLYPLATLTKEPMDAEDGVVLWAYIGILTIAAVIVPLFVPRVYTPIDPKRSSEVIHPEQSVSILSRLTYSYLDSLILKARKVAHLELDQLPPVPDYDEATHLVTKNLLILDTYIRRKRHIFFGLLSTMRYEYTAVFFGD
ncbi:hypothetical protein EIP91_010784, partial [Steccherinum ochraceum]